jgi:acetoin utilization deacetylase AcuC-like enzyme
MTTVYVTHPRYTDHNLSGHPEHAGRIRSVWQKLSDAGLIQRMKLVEAEPVDPDLILSVHTPKYLEILRWIGGQNNPVHVDADTYALPASFHIACLSAGGVVNAIDAVLRREAANGLAAVRPPGHHALPERGMGFCLLGNIAIAARHAQQQYGVSRVMIIDFDVHHGNGTQDMFYDDNSVLFISTHQHPFYPGTGAIGETGTGKGKGYTINIPLSAGHGDTSYAAIYEQIVWPAARRFQPELILVSAGFDAHYSDPLAMMLLSLRGYNHITRELIRMAEQFCGGRIVFVMEGGYDLEALGHGVRNIAHALLGESEVSDPFGLSDRQEIDVTPVIERVRQIHGL